MYLLKRECEMKSIVISKNGDATLKGYNPQDCANIDPKVESLVHEVIGRVADKWTMIVLETLTQHGELRFTRLAELAGGISQKMLTQTLRQMERDGFVIRTVHPIIPPRVEYKLTAMGFNLSGAFCSVWLWAEENLSAIEKARETYDTQKLL
jgi:DNA-binding HxlR family transcriptional regulator